ncbi:MAG: hypothetical protein ACE5EO_06765 [Candidatus Krumholzibacteriia bacterium]
MNKKWTKVLAVVFPVLVLVVAWTWLADGLADRTTTVEKLNQQNLGALDEEDPEEDVAVIGPLNLGKMMGTVSYDRMKDSYYLQVKGTRLPFKTSPIAAQHVPLEASGGDELARNTALLYGIVGREVLHATLLINPDEENEVMPAVMDISQYIQIANRRKFAGVAYTKPGGKMERSVLKGAQIQALEDGTTRTPIIQIKGPKSGATKTGVTVVDKGRVVVEGKTYEDLYEAADRICITLVKMLCGSPTCPDAASCATGGDCGCG